MDGAWVASLRDALAVAGAPGGAIAAGKVSCGVEHWGAVPVGAAVEAGSVTKAVTGLLLSLAQAGGEADPDDELGRFLAVGRAGGVTLAALATHTSGLPRLPALFGMQMLRHPRNPYRGYSLNRLLWATRRTSLAGAGQYRYSNLGVALLGHALARAAGTDYWTLATERVLRPLGMHRSGALPDSETWTSGRLWNLEAFGPAGGLRAPVEDLFSLAQLAAEPSQSPLGAAAVDAVRPRLAAGDARVGWCWMTSTTSAGEVRWHNGGTGAAWAIVAGSPRVAVAVSVPTGPRPDYDLAIMRTLADPDAGRAYGEPRRHA